MQKNVNMLKRVIGGKQSQIGACKLILAAGTANVSGRQKSWEERSSQRWTAVPAAGGKDKKKDASLKGELPNFYLPR